MHNVQLFLINVHCSMSVNIIVIMIVKIIVLIIMIAKIITMIINISPEARPSCYQALRCRLDISQGCDLPEDWK